MADVVPFPPTGALGMIAAECMHSPTSRQCTRGQSNMDDHCKSRVICAIATERMLDELDASSLAAGRLPTSVVLAEMTGGEEPGRLLGTDPAGMSFRRSDIHGLVAAECEFGDGHRRCVHLGTMRQCLPLRDACALANEREAKNGQGAVHAD